jgi:hypothetical protein
MNTDDTDRKGKSGQEKRMTRYHRVSASIGVAALSACAFAFQGSPSAQTQPKKTSAKTTAPMQTFVGVITDGQCAVKGSHKEVMAKAKVNTAANCVKGCARRYWYVLYVPSTKKVYKLSDQERPAELAARKVRIKGALDQATQTIYVSSIEPVL